MDPGQDRAPEWLSVEIVGSRIGLHSQRNGTSLFHEPLRQKGAREKTPDRLNEVPLTQPGELVVVSSKLPLGCDMISG